MLLRLLHEARKELPGDTAGLLVGLITCMLRDIEGSVTNDWIFFAGTFLIMGEECPESECPCESSPNFFGPTLNLG